MSDTLPTLCPPTPENFPRLLAKTLPEDFIVEELALYEPSGAGTHSYFWIEKRQMNTLDVTRRLGAFFKKRGADAGVAGLKDAQAISRQWISLEHVPDAQRALTMDDPKVKVLKISSHGNKLKMGHLRGNRFVIRLRPEAPLTPEMGGVVLQRAREVLETLQRVGMPNFFGPQRFGRDGDNVSLGRLLVAGDNAGFEAEFSKKNRRPPDRKLRNLLVNSFQSELFNRVLSARMPEIGKLREGDLAYLHRNGAVFSVTSAEEAAKEQPRADAFEISPSGPMFGPKTPQASGSAGEIEAAVLKDAGVTSDDFGRNEAERQPGARRSLRMPLLEAPTAEMDADGLLLKFALPSGAYASVVMREITGSGAASIDV
jgi:tRNA pseudouridine13 synthase